MSESPFLWRALPAAALLWVVRLDAAQTNLPPLEAPLAGAGVSFLRVIGALILVLALFGGVVWFIRNSQRLGLPMGTRSKLRVLESRTLSYRHSLYVVAFERQRFLLGASPNEISLLASLPPAENAAADPPPPPVSGFADTLRQMLRRQP